MVVRVFTASIYMLAARAEQVRDLFVTPFVVAVGMYVACATLAPEEGGDPL